jgi:putative FmdB family regulatory protein
MPLYEYRCKNCQKRVEVLVPSGTAARDLECPECGKKKLEKLFSTFAAHGGSTGASAAEPCGSPGCPRTSGFT